MNAEIITENFLRNGKKQVDNPFDDEEWDENDNSENVLTDNGKIIAR